MFECPYTYVQNSACIVLELSPSLCLTSDSRKCVEGREAVLLWRSIWIDLWQGHKEQGALSPPPPRPQYISQLISCTISPAGPLRTTGIGSFVPVSALLQVSQGCVSVCQREGVWAHVQNIWILVSFLFFIYFLIIYFSSVWLCFF